MVVKTFGTITLARVDDGAQGTPGKPGTDGKTPYLHTAYSWSADGTDRFTTVYPGRNYYQQNTPAKVIPLPTSTYKPNLERPNADCPNGFKLTGARDNSGTVRFNNVITGNGWWTVSFLMRGIQKTAVDLTLDACDLSPVKMVTSSDDTWKKYVYTVNITNYSAACNYVDFSNMTWMWFLIKDFKVEQGDTPTPYTPSPLDDPEGAYPQFIGTYTDYTADDSTDPSKYTWAKLRGEKGDKGADGAQGTPGKAGVDGKTPYFHQAWADSQDGKTNFSKTISLGKKYLGTYTDYVADDSADPTKYKWTELVGAIEIGGRNLVSGTNQEYAMGYGIPTTSWKDGYAYLKLPTNVINGKILPQAPHTFWYTMIQGETYTQTIWFETDATVKDLSTGVAQITWYTRAGHDVQPARVQKLGQNSYKVVSTYTWPGKSDNNVRLFDIENLDYAFDLKTGTYLKFGKLKLEIGNKSTDWSPAPEDVQAYTDQKAAEALAKAKDEIKLVPKITSGTSFPSTRKTGDMHWMTNSAGVVTGYYKFDGSQWVVQKIDAQSLNVSSLSALSANLGNITAGTINGVNINGSKLTATYKHALIEGDVGYTDNYSTGGMTISDGKIIIDGNIESDEGVDSGQRYNTSLLPRGFSNYITSDDTTYLSSAGIAYGQIYLSEWVSGSGNTAVYRGANIDVGSVYDSDWQNLTFVGGAITSPSNPVKIRRIGKMVYLTGDLRLPLTTGYVWCTIPEEFRPEYDSRYTTFAEDSELYRMIFWVRTSGQISTIFNTQTIRNYHLVGTSWTVREA